ncbi:hypothetical protein BU23DRAFT_580091 [Bimuria novae-zelandiae CBS 107.79]|uniref:Transcription factor RfeG n=1 Tax=Bimuria novae-zelandiae CBS 107.79 TaxID=1447943 RepID=A0A6A5VAP2_9PLEO|nr:hypothetical protein BU23DRAFT_580091 [Bimuria novae-zelandiae CBS 107.79]
MSSRKNQWFVLGDGIAREVITADIQRYLGPDALVKPGLGTGEYEGRQGYWITAYRTLTSQMIQDLRSDSQRWQAEKDRSGRGGGTPTFGDKKMSRLPDASVVAYQDSTIHASRQYHGPTTSEPYAPAPSSKQSYPSPSYGTSESPHYTTAPTAAYSTHAYQAPSHAAHPAQPRTDPTYYGQHASYGSTPAPAAYSYAQPPVQDPYGRSPAPQYAQSTPSPASVVASPGYYIASDGRQYPLSQQPQQPQPPPAGRRR